MNHHCEIFFLGTGTIFPDPQRACSSAILKTSKHHILIDLGAGTLRRMALEGWDIHKIDYVFITHFHPDHIGDLVPLIFSLLNAHHASSDKAGIEIYGPVGLYTFLKHMEQAYGRWVTHPDHQIKFHELTDQPVDFPGFAVTWTHVSHTQESLGYRFKIGDKVIVFSGDSGDCPELVQLCQQADIAVLECSHADELAVEGHLTPTLAAQIAEKAAVKRVILTHFYPDALQSNPVEIARNLFTGEVLMARDGASFST